MKRGALVTLTLQLCIVAVIAGGALTGLWFGLRIYRKVRAERRHDNAVEEACQKVDLLSARLNHAESKVGEGQHGTLEEVRAAHVRLSELKDQYYHEGATPEEWIALGRQAQANADKAWRLAQEVK